MTGQLVSKVTGTVVDVIGETGTFWWAAHRDGIDEPPFSVPKGHPNWMQHVPVPEVGDIWRAGGDSGTKYRVLGVDVKRKVVHWVLADAFHDGDYPIPDPGRVQVNEAPDCDIFTREFPEEFLTFVRKGA